MFYECLNGKCRQSKDKPLIGRFSIGDGYMKQVSFLLCLTLMLCVQGCGQLEQTDARVSIQDSDARVYEVFGKYFPDIPGYKTLVCDFHTHTVFSDGLVWPSVRVDEARRESIDVIAITDHIEYLPHKDDLLKNHNRSYRIAKEAGDKKNTLVIKGTEITRDTPPGHYNALFISDVSPLDHEDFLTQIERANKQNGFVFWNHHTWKGEQKGLWEQIQTTMYDEGWLHGMEVANGGTYYPLAHKWCLDKDLTMLGNSDIHEPSINHKYTPDKHRSLTLVFAKECTRESVREALDSGRTAVWYQNKLIGKEEYLNKLFKQIVKASDFKKENGNITCKLTNSALIDLNMERKGKYGPEKITIPAKSSVSLTSKNNKIKYYVTNLQINPKESLVVEIILATQEAK